MPVKISGEGLKPFRFSFDESTTLKMLTDRIEAESSLSYYVLQMGWPPIEIRGDAEDCLASLGLKNGESVVVRESSSVHPIVKTKLPDIERHIIPADNSCLFNAIAFLMSNGEAAENGISKEYRGIVSHEILTDQTGTYSEAFLGKKPHEYAEWVQDPDKWGGEIEMSILSKRLHIQICAVDIQTGTVYKYSPEGPHEHSSIYLMYDGIHYDAVVCRMPAAKTGENHFKTIFHPESNSAVEEQCVALALKLKNSRQFTDTTNFDIRCMICNEGLVGETGAREHAMRTGHQNFCEYS